MRIGSFFLMITLTVSHAISQVDFTRAEAGDLSFYPGGDWLTGGTRGGTWVDFDQDGDIDFFSGSLFYENNSMGQFIADSLIYVGNPPVVVDLTNDGLLDLVIGGRSFYEDGDSVFTKIFINKGDGFDEISLDDSYGYYSATCVDINEDGFIDIFLTDPQGNRFYISDQGRSFTQKPEFQHDYGSSYYGTWTDYDNDGDMDLLADGLYQNNGRGIFERKFETTGFSWGDVNNDGFSDFYAPTEESDAIYTNNGDGTFSADSIGDKGILYAVGSSFGDLDNDGDLDLVTVNGGSTVYLNNDGTYQSAHLQIHALRATETEYNNFDQERILNPVWYWGVSLGDFNLDGHLDVIVGTDDGTPNDVLLNNGNSNSWLTVQLEGTESNYSGIGARVIAEAQINGEVVKQYRTQRSRHGPHAGNLDIHFGLGDATVVDKLTVEWPSGNLTELRNVNVRQWLTINEDMITSVLPDSKTSSLIYPNPSTEHIIIKSTVDYHGVVRINMYSYRGEEILSSTVHKGQGQFEHKIRVLDLAAGVYLLKVQLGDQTFTQKFIKE